MRRADITEQTRRRYIEGIVASGDPDVSPERLGMILQISSTATRYYLYRHPEVRALAREELASRGITDRRADEGVKVAPLGVGRAVDPEDPVVRAAAVRTLRKGWITRDELAARLRLSLEGVDTLLRELSACAYIVQRDEDRVRITHTPPHGTSTESAPLTGESVTIGVISDTHLCSEKARLETLAAAYDDFAARGIEHVYHCGNMIDGECSWNQYELLAHGVHDQTLYCIDHYPQRSGITTHFVTGDCHEGWFHTQVGVNWGMYLKMLAQEHGRYDLDYIGFMESDVKLQASGATQPSVMRLFHPGGGSAYSLSYRPQRIIESLSGGEKPAILLIGHYHKLAYFMFRNVHVLLCGCVQDQTPYMRKRSIEAHVGYIVLTIEQDVKGGVRRVTPTITSYYDRTYHIESILPMP